jgi:hypothetical protein
VLLSRAIAGGLALFFGTAACGILQSSNGSTPSARAESQSPPAKLLGAGSCASSSCHNRGDVHGIAGREYAIAITDPHDGAYAVLLKDNSKKIEQRLHGLPDWRTAHPERDVLCLKCHVHPEIDHRDSHVADGVRQFRFEDGVSCEACHGAAERWLDVHHRAEWKSLSPEEKKREFGMLDVRSVKERAQSCVACHVGAPGMDVNHDLIAAGHPRLAFEFSGYHRMMKHHWDDALDLVLSRGGRPDFETQAWAVGQLTTLKASLELLRSRAMKMPWPELAEFDCYACHHDLQNPGTKQDLTFPGRKAGQIMCNPWPFANALLAYSLLGGDDVASFENRVAIIKANVGVKTPPPDVMQREIPALFKQIDAVLGREPNGVMPIRASMAALVKARPQTWDAAAQTFLGLSAFEKSRIDQGLPEVPMLRTNLQALRDLLTPDSRYRMKDLRTTMERIAEIIGK